MPSPNFFNEWGCKYGWAMTTGCMLWYIIILSYPFGNSKWPIANSQNKVKIWKFRPNHSLLALFQWAAVNISFNFKGRKILPKNKGVNPFWPFSNFRKSLETWKFRTKNELFDSFYSFEAKFICFFEVEKFHQKVKELTQFLAIFSTIFKLSKQGQNMKFQAKELSFALIWIISH